ncbi:MAG TPA: ATP-binding cassette domain-containing protein [Candidatus Binataceae bacterium]|jgi:ABC-2 type transport system ATP-binding protein|nr:ATP-binding cassette domain-containing protein [Candidatus Binataceae bacterium]
MNASSATGAPRAERAAPISAEPAIEVADLSFSYGDRPALSTVEFTIARGEIFGFLGPNGGGKSTLFRLLSTLVPIQSGDARILGCDLRGATQALRRRIGVVFQSPSLDGKLTVAENLAIHGNLYGMRGARLKERAQAMLARLDVSDRAGDLAETLSGGLRRRVELAKALLHEPELLLLDEPSTGLDPAARREFFALLTRLRESDGVTIVLTTHYMEEAERCDRIGILDQGRLVAIAPPGELKQRVGGDVMVISTAAPEALAQKIAQRLQVRAALVDGTLRIERPRGHELVARLVDEFGGEIESITFGRPTLEDVFVHLTGHRFRARAREEREEGGR